jgi:DNA-binding NtrC family response regulator
MRSKRSTPEEIMDQLANGGVQVIQPYPLKKPINKPSVLVVDDEPAIRRFLVNWINGWGYQVSAVAGATEALESMLRAPADVVLCDIRMPGHDGMWLANTIRKRWPRSVSIITTGVMDVDVVMECQRLGAVDYVTKPFGRELLLQALARATTMLQRASRRP